MHDFRMRQVHLDFHTSEAIEGIGKDFDAERFASVLQEARVDSITCFSRCHHGWLYYPSKKFPERIHPHLACKDLLGEQIEACHKRDIKVPVYLPLQWDNLMATEHPEWLVMDETGRPVGSGPYQPGFYRQLCLNTPYREFVVEQAKEVLEMYPADGLFMDIINVKECSCAHCKKGMIEEGMDPSCKSDRITYTRKVIKDFTEYVSGELRKVQADIPLFYNHSHVRTTHRQIIDGFTHLELESLPSGGWGYWDFTITVRYARTLGLPCIGMTGKFHTAWGDFHSLKSDAALEFECFRSLALNAGISIGDQLHPYGDLAPEAYALIGRVYKSVEEKEPWCRGAEPLVEMAVVSPDGFWGTPKGYFSPEIEGSCRMLQEAGYQFNVIDQVEDLSQYKLVVLPDLVSLTPEFEKAVAEYVKGGGKLISTYKSLDGTSVDWGFEVTEEAPYSPDFIVATGALGKGLADANYVMYDKAMMVEPKDGCEVVSFVDVPFFNRTWEHYCSHRHTPSSFTKGYPAVVRKGGHIHFIHPIFASYSKYNPLWYKTLVSNSIEMLMGRGMLEHDGPSTVMATVNEQPNTNRYVVHALHYIPERRGSEFDTIEDVIPLHDLTISLSLEKKANKAFLVPEMVEIELEHSSDGRQSFTIPKVNGHAMVALEY